MTQFTKVEYNNRQIVGYNLDIKENDSNYLNAFDLFQNKLEESDGVLIKNDVKSIQVQLDLQNAPQLFIIAFDESNFKTGVSVNYLVSESPYSIMLSEKKYVILPYSKDIEPQGIVKIIELRY